MLNRNILVTGGAGYIGSHVCKLLHQQGYTPVVYDNLVSGHDWAVRWGPLIQADLLDRKQLLKAFVDYQPSVVMHLAGLICVGESVTQPERYYQNNVEGSRTLLEVMSQVQCQKVIFSSTCAIYGDPKVIPMPENHPINPVNPYGENKWAVEQLLSNYLKQSNISSVSLRFFNVAGADIGGEVGESHHPETHLIPRILEAIHREQPIEIFGDDYPTKDGTCIRDYIHVMDIAKAHSLSMNKLNSDTGCFSYNLGSGSGYSVLEVIHEVETVIGKKAKKQIQGRRAGDAVELRADSRSATKELGWKPQYDLNIMLKTAWQWYQKNIE